MAHVLKLIEGTISSSKIFSFLLSRQIVSISLMWLFTISALVGIGFGMMDWFVPKTPVNLLLCFALMVVNLPVKDIKSISLFFICFITGMSAEIIGVHSGYIFGDYYYGDNMGIKLLGVPVMIGVYWSVLVMVTNQIARSIFKSIWGVTLFATLLMLGLDFLMEQMASTFDFWHFSGGVAGAQNYIGWGIIAFILNLLAFKMMEKGGERFSLHLYINQVAFFLVSLLLLL